MHIANSLAYTTITGRRPPQQPPTAKNYTAAGLPWFDYYDDELKALKGAEKLARLDSVAAKKIKKNDGPLRDNDPVSPGALVKLGKQKHTVREGSF